MWGDWSVVSTMLQSPVLYGVRYGAVENTYKENTKRRNFFFDGVCPADWGYSCPQSSGFE